MLNLFGDFEKALTFLATGTVLIIIGIAGSIIALQQIGKNNRTMKGTISQANEKFYRSLNKRFSKVANAIGNEDAAAEASLQVVASYLTTFGNDVRRGFDVISSDYIKSGKNLKKNKIQ